LYTNPYATFIAGLINLFWRLWGRAGRLFALYVNSTNGLQKTVVYIKQNLTLPGFLAFLGIWHFGHTNGHGVTVWAYCNFLPVYGGQKTTYHYYLA
jgi:hypothetical protein